MSILSKEKLLIIIFSAAITSLVIHFISGSFFYVSHPFLIMFFTVAVAVTVSGFIVTKILPTEDK